MKILVTGGAGFIGSALVRHLVSDKGADVCTVDKLTYSGNLANLASLEDAKGHTFRQIDICDSASLERCLADFQPDAIMHLAAESHVDRSIDGPAAFIETNILGTFNLLEVAREYAAGRDFRFLHVSTDEVFGALGETGRFDEDSPYRPNSPYSASKAASDHLVRAWYETYDFPVVVTNCSNNYGPYQFPEKLIPLTILNAIDRKPIPVYGDGQQVRDWLYVLDHVAGLCEVLERGKLGRTYNLGGNCEKTNVEVVTAIVDEVARQLDRDPGEERRLITFVADRPGHDRRYAIDTSRVGREIGWQPETDFAQGICRTVRWYMENPDWTEEVVQKFARARLGQLKT
ncbi:MAG: dTDP-glucose 4,6-dehydratase [Proteobacteria bacterium]|nr:dTDP-glucose 4,6-dehydratase [Pseudomonadota bacterium]